jgi:hypothetical protein
VLENIDFQIGYFKCPPATEQTTSSRIEVSPFSEWPGDLAGTRSPSIFYSSTGQSGKDFVDPQNRLAIVREEFGFTVYADYPNFLINLYIQLLLVPMGFTMVHAAGYRASNGAVTVVTGAGGIGKTAILGHAVMQKGLKHFGDDVVILSKTGLCMPFPRSFVLKSYHRDQYSEVFQRNKLPRRNFYHAKTFIVENAPFVGIGKSFLRRTGLYYRAAALLRRQPYLATVSPDDIFGQGSVGSAAEIGRVIYLERAYASDFKLSPSSSSELTNRMCSVIHYEWKEFLEHLLSLGALNVVNFSEYLQASIQNLSDSLRGKELLHLTVPAKTTPQRLVEYFESQQLF